MSLATEILNLLIIQERKKGIEDTFWVIFFFFMEWGNIPLQCINSNWDEKRWKVLIFPLFFFFEQQRDRKHALVNSGWKLSFSLSNLMFIPHWKLGLSEFKVYPNLKLIQIQSCNGGSFHFKFKNLVTMWNVEDEYWQIVFSIQKSIKIAWMQNHFQGLIWWDQILELVVKWVPTPNSHKSEKHMNHQKCWLGT